MALVYTSATEVGARVPGRTISTGTKPTTAQVEQWLAEGEALLLAGISARGLSAPADTTTSAGQILKSWATDFAEAHVRMAWASTAGDENKDGQSLLERFDKRLDELYAGRYDDAIGSTGSASTAHGANTDTTADDYVAPEFERGEVF
jgi:hypothetical protein